LFCQLRTRWLPFMAGPLVHLAKELSDVCFQSVACRSSDQAFETCTQSTAIATRLARTFSDRGRLLWLTSWPFLELLLATEFSAARAPWLIFYGG